MICHGCSEPIKPSKAKPSAVTNATITNYTYTCRCGHEMTWTGRSRTEPANAAPVEHRVGAHFNARPRSGTVVG